MNIKILLVEDHPMNREMLTRRLRKLNYEVVTAENGAEAIDQARVREPDLILMDMSLPVMDGWEATREIKSRPETASIPVIALTAYVHDFDKQKAMEAGCDEYETKPVDMQQLVRKITDLVEKRRNTNTSACFL